MSRRPDVQWKPAPAETRSAAQSVPCPFTPGCTGRTDYLTHDVFGTVERCRRCGQRQRITGRLPVDSIESPRHGVVPKDKAGRKRKARVCSAHECKNEPPVGRKTCSDACLRAVEAAGGQKGGGTMKARWAAESARKLAEGRKQQGRPGRICSAPGCGKEISIWRKRTCSDACARNAIVASRKRPRLHGIIAAPWAMETSA